MDYGAVVAEHYYWVFHQTSNMSERFISFHSVAYNQVNLSLSWKLKGDVCHDSKLKLSMPQKGKKKRNKKNFQGLRIFGGGEEDMVLRGDQTNGQKPDIEFLKRKMIFANLRCIGCFGFCLY
ncbi:uncharacterized protein LOC106358315 [Brassica napus]|uniref:uncharacterized protein LOC106358315 n=1 Tax=Brassica napus TaxID=3708 RepID=UPI0020785355|nr:uncharacterized protein LOC106358315 [Brassica napus]